MLRTGVEIALDPCCYLLAERWGDPIERLARATRRRAAHERRRDPFPAQMLRDQVGRAGATRRERPIVIGELRVLPAGLRMAQEKQLPYRRPLPFR
jgi:hypothetical protein